MTQHSHVAIPAADDPGLKYKDTSDALMASLLDNPGESGESDEAAARAVSRAEQYRVGGIRTALRDPGTTVEQLIEAAADPNPMVRRAVIAHPGCPPALRLAALQDPDGEVRAEVVRIIADLAELPADIVTDDKWAVRAALAERADCPAQLVVELLHHDPDPEVRRRALAAGVGRRDVVRRLLREQPGIGAPATDAANRTPRFLLAVPHEHAREALTQRPGVDYAMLLWLTFHDPSPTVRASAVRNPRVSTRLLRRIFRDPAPEPRAAAVLRVGFPSDLVGAAAHDDSWLVRHAALRHSPLDPAIPARLSQDPKPAVRIRACAHADCPPEALARAAEVSDVEVRRAAVANPSMPRSSLATLCRDQDLDIQLLAIQHPAAPPAFAAFGVYRESKAVLAIKVKADDEAAGARRRHAQRMNESAAGALVRAPWAELRPLPLTQLPQGLINRVIAEHLDDVVTDHRITIRRLAVQHPAVRARHLAALSTDPDPEIRAAAGTRVLEIV